MNVHTIATLADATGLAPVTIRAYLSRGQMPAPDGYLSRTPYWNHDTIQEWIDSRRPNPDRWEPGDDGPRPSTVYGY